MKRVFALVLAFSIVLVSCSTSPEQALADFCNAQDNLVTALGGVSDLSLDSTVEDIEAAGDEISAAWDDYKKAAGELSDVSVTQVESAQQDFIDAVDQISGESLADSVNQVVDAAAAFLAEVGAIADSVTCE